MTHTSNNPLDAEPRPQPQPRPAARFQLCTIRAFLRTLVACLLPRTKQNQSYEALPEEPSKQLYEALPEKNSIRLLNIHPGAADETIRCSLILAGIDEDPPPYYEALSYVWGGTEDSRSIICNGLTVHGVRKNLFDALDRLRDPEKERIIWVDGICMNQEDSEEKTAQVRLMQHIYRNARHVIVWLGTDEYDEAHRCFEILCAVVNETRNRESKAQLATFRSMGEEYQAGNMPCPPPVESDDWTNVAALFLNKWFVRMWVLQEIVLARSATFIWGAAEIDWVIIGEALQTIRSSENRYINNLLENRHWQNADFMNRVSGMGADEQKRRVAFMHLLDWTRSFEVSDARDKVYGLLGFPTRDADPRNSNGVFMEPRYDISVAETYAKVAKKVMEKSQTLDILSYINHRPDVVYCPGGLIKDQHFQHVPKHLYPTWTELPDGILQLNWPPDYPSEKELPNWVPNWNTGVVTVALIGFPKGQQYAAGKHKPQKLLEISNPNTLTLKGVIIDVVSEVLPSMPLTNIMESEDGLRRLLRWCISTGAPPFAIARAITGGRDSDYRLVTDADQMLADFCAYIQSLDTDWLATAWPDSASHLSTLATERGNPQMLQETIWKFNFYRSVFIAKEGNLGLGPCAMQAGDLVVVLWGGQVPFVLREEDGGDWYRCVGECYVDGFMQGEVAEWLVEVESHKERVFELR
ncbi:heterokaryon incompatibility protein-domain-containing protein [Clohesyomyces aquaticus]|uniref:Heterokaryon incompatibility protein-domain-containing protein n=1 Tax=Clohesyomyces aquaticus TaxID=1231657 RepID=A0A1Y1ZL18_9PLEO|nr:heterokaryon incompatibility protein-domain-containing protein [Clohesyomyces aquaticus]